MKKFANEVPSSIRRDLSWGITLIESASRSSVRIKRILGCFGGSGAGMAAGSDLEHATPIEASRRSRLRKNL
jgi:hypothetical protein